MTAQRGSVPPHSGQPATTRFGLPDSTFGSHEWQIHQRAAHDPDFRSLCEEHEEALRAVEHFRASDAPHPRITEYADLVEELRKDILQELETIRK